MWAKEIKKERKLYGIQFLISTEKKLFSLLNHWDAYHLAFPKSRHRSVGKQTGKTNPIERFNNTLRQRLSRLVRKSLSFSKKVENLIGSLLFFYRIIMRLFNYNSSFILQDYQQMENDL
jgi:IS1 family transposase